MTTIKIGISASSYYQADGVTIDYRAIKADGFDCVDLNQFSEPAHPIYTMSDTELAAFFEREKAAITEAGLLPYQFHGVWPTDDTSPEKRAQKEQWLIRDITCCALLDCRYLILHPDMPFGWNSEEDPMAAYESNVTLFRRLLPYAEAHDVTLCLENMPFKSHAISGVAKTLEFVRAHNHPKLGVCLDTGHAMVLGDGCGDMVRLLGNALKVLHVHDNDGVCDRHWCPFEGMIDWEDFRAALQEIRFDGCLSLECGVPADCPDAERPQNRKALAATALYLAGR